MYDPIRPDREQRPILAAGRVAVAPAATGDSVMVTLRNYSYAHAYEVIAGHWSPVGATLPAKGADCLVGFDDDGDAWILQFDHTYGG